MGVSGGKMGVKGGVMLIPIELVFTFEGPYVCANFGENRSRNATVGVRTDGYT